jgi:hypothetical protein
MSKGSGVMSKDYFRQRGATAPPAAMKEVSKAEDTTSSSTPDKPPSTPTAAAVPPGESIGKMRFNGASSRQAGLGVGSQIMSKNHFRTLRPPKSKGMDGEGSHEPPVPTRMPSPPTLRRADTWAGSSEDVHVPPPLHISRYAAAHSTLSSNPPFHPRLLSAHASLL